MRVRHTPPLARQRAVRVVFQRLQIRAPNHGGGFGLRQGDAFFFSGRAQHGAQLTHEYVASETIHQ